MALRARKDSGTLEKREVGKLCEKSFEFSQLTFLLWYSFDIGLQELKCRTHKIFRI